MDYIFGLELSQYSRWNVQLGTSVSLDDCLLFLPSLLVVLWCCGFYGYWERTTPLPILLCNLLL